jgi:ankyrin repeat protein
LNADSAFYTALPPNSVHHKRKLDGYTALHVAARNNQPSLVKILVDAGAKLDAGDDK